LLNLKNTLKVAFKVIVAAVWMLGTQVISIAGFMGFMVMPLLLWVLVLPNNSYATYELSGIFLGGISVSGIIFYSGFIIFCASLIQWFWYRHKKEKFFTKGLYSKVRHPQFLGIILVSLGLTVGLLTIIDNWDLVTPFLRLPHWSLSMNELIGLWFLQVLGYIAFALVEERGLSKKFPEFKDYKQKVPLLLPVKKPKMIPEAVFTIMLVLVVCAILFLLPYNLLFWLHLP
jgi:protein-S-isoprenylcysteine O-methyltransferase Ste14